MESTSQVEPFNSSVGVLDLSESVRRGLNHVLKHSPKKAASVQQGPDEGALLNEVFSTLFEKAEAVERRAELFLPESRENFIANLWWMIEQGVEEDLYALRRLKKNLPYQDEDIDEFMRIADERILKRVNDPDYVLKNGEDAYRSNQKMWDEEYADQFIAVYGRRVVAHAATEDELWPKLKQVQNERGPFRAYIIKVGLKMPVFRGPQVQLAKTLMRQRSDEENS